MPPTRDPAPRRRLVALGITALVACVVGLAVGSGAGGEEEEAAGPAERHGRAELGPARGLSLERQVGELLVMSFDGTAVPPYISRRLRAGQGTGVILFAKNAPDAPILRALTRDLQDAARGTALVATDQEGGPIRSVAFAPPGEAPGRVGDRARAASDAGEAAKALRGVGVNVNLAPVADVAVPGSVMAARAYPGDAAAVAPLVAAAVRAHARERVAATVKHFPGLGAASANTDDESVTVPATAAEVRSRDLPPFRAAIRAGAPLVMASHALYPALDRGRIASQSQPVLVDLLREELGFRGVVVTDSIEAQAVLDRSPVGEAAERSVEAGADLVLMTGSGSWNLVQPRLLARARRDRRFRARVADSASRVLALKRRLGIVRR